ncbi:ribosome small subunit-dependent GTPase A [Fulvivirgaceae bacterium BMA12]|uniref:Small ribosomal subunit biogenesis GTPase RsgA n=1 Tax=Agaribacillus aureus TaxID=3051825 RepID=A0ABT8L6R7_9BACT|nr:ribosome small subunit-dependent GTPase A [Fulvivirgaceae bacterium BMA12]
MEGKVFKSTGLWYEVVDNHGNHHKCRLRGKIKLKGMKTSNPIAVGDSVQFYLEDNPENTGVITKILPRNNYIVRKATQKSKQSHILAANIDQAILMVTHTYPKTSLGFIDRFLVTAESFRIPVIILFNKCDLLGEEEEGAVKKIMALYETIGYSSHLISVLEDTGIDSFFNIIKGKTSLLAGHSGVGKSSLLNKVIPDIDQKIGDVSNFANKGIHTTTFAEMFEAAPGTYLIDTPGIKELGLSEIDRQELSHYFPEMRDLLGKCKFHNCHHIHEPGCLILQSLENGDIAQTRYDSYFSMYHNEDNRR